MRNTLHLVALRQRGIRKIVSSYNHEISSSFFKQKMFFKISHLDRCLELCHISLQKILHEFCPVTVKTVHACLLTSKLCAEVWRTGYECSLNPKNENLKLEMETPKFPAKIDFNFHWKNSSLQTETSDFGPDFLFSFLNSAQPTGWIL